MVLILTIEKKIQLCKYVLIHLHVYFIYTFYSLLSLNTFKTSSIINYHIQSNTHLHHVWSGGGDCIQLLPALHCVIIWPHVQTTADPLCCGNKKPKGFGCSSQSPAPDPPPRGFIVFIVWHSLGCLEAFFQITLVFLLLNY